MIIPIIKSIPITRKKWWKVHLLKYCSAIAIPHYFTRYLLVKKTYFLLLSIYLAIIATSDFACIVLHPKRMMGL